MRQALMHRFPLQSLHLHFCFVRIWSCVRQFIEHLLQRKDLSSKDAERALEVRKFTRGSTRADLELVCRLPAAPAGG